MAITTKAGFVQRGFGQVEPNHLSAQRTGQIYAQLPAAADIDLLENGQFVKYDYATGEVNFTGAGEWMLVFNEVKTYYDYEPDCYFAMKKANYNARVYSPIGADTLTKGQARDYSDFAQAGIAMDGTANPFEITTYTGPALMYELDEEGKKTNVKTMVPRVFKTNVGDIMTTNTIKDADVALGNKLVIGAEGILEVNNDATEGMIWQVAKVYTMPDGQPGAKIVRIA